MQATRTIPVTVNPAADSPPTIGSGLLRWGKPDALGLVDGAACQTNSDQSGEGHHFAQPSPASRPVYKANIANGLGMLLHDGVNDWMACDALAALFPTPQTPFTFGIVFKFSSVVQNNTGSCFLMLASVTGQPNPTHDVFLRLASNDICTAYRNDAGNEITILSGWTPDTGLHTLIYTWDGTTSVIYIDGVADGSISAPLPGTFTAVNSFTYGSHRRVDVGNVSLPFRGYWGEDVLYATAFSPSDVALLNSYFVGRYNTPTSIPFDPVMIPNMMVGWYRDDSSIVLTNGSAPSLWYSRHIVQNYPYNSNALPQGAPTYRTNILNGRGAMLLNGTTQRFVVPNGWNASYILSGINKPFTIAIVCKSLDQSAVRSPWSMSSNIPVQQSLAILQQGSSYTFTRTDNAGHTKSISGGTPDGDAHAIVCVFDGVNGSIYVDDVIVASGNLSAGLGQADLKNCNMGCKLVGTNTTSEFFNGYAFEFVQWYRAITEVELSDLSGYFRARWGTP